jgi:hypothetical protein
MENFQTPTYPQLPQVVEQQLEQVGQPVQQAGFPPMMQQQVMPQQYASQQAQQPAYLVPQQQVIALTREDLVIRAFFQDSSVGPKMR